MGRGCWAWTGAVLGMVGSAEVFQGVGRGVGKMKKGSLRSKERSLEAILPEVPRICVDAGAYAYTIMSKPCLGIP
ncbi:hypothetical protein PIB30_098081 [Stylosanthes scabra]|uniref:Uncharacterized protein n=1 Tax=Stylosanthes scabra TaxID=79078 RepID=A0ABU6QVY1_9FABA|nr:hypothetical protein [Stylosanthes scabra]